jgi:hypothetical protein
MKGGNQNMMTTHKLTTDLLTKGPIQTIEVVQGDTLTRMMELTVLCGGESWEVPGCDFTIRYRKSDGTSGSYIKVLGQPAVQCTGNVLTLLLSPDLMDQPGIVQVQVELNSLDLRLRTFPFLILVDPALEVV